MTIGVGQDSFETLRTRSNTLHCGMSRAIFKVVKGCKVNQAQTQQATVDESTAATNATDQMELELMQQGNSIHTDPVAGATIPVEKSAN